MADFIFNISLGRIVHYASLPATNDALILVLLKSAGLEADGTLRDYDTLGALLAAANDEADFTGYTRRTLAGVSAGTPDDTNNRVDSDANDPSSYTNSGGSSQSIGKALIVYDPDTTTGDDTTVIPVAAYDAVVTFDPGIATSAAFNAAGIWRASAA